MKKFKHLLNSVRVSLVAAMYTFYVCISVYFAFTVAYHGFYFFDGAFLASNDVFFSSKDSSVGFISVVIFEAVALFFILGQSPSSVSSLKWFFVAPILILFCVLLLALNAPHSAILPIIDAISEYLMIFVTLLCSLLLKFCSVFPSKRIEIKG